MADTDTHNKVRPYISSAWVGGWAGYLAQAREDAGKSPRTEHAHSERHHERQVQQRLAHLFHHLRPALHGRVEILQCVRWAERK